MWPLACACFIALALAAQQVEVDAVAEGPCPPTANGDSAACLAGVLRDRSADEEARAAAALRLGCLGGDEAVRQLEGALREASPVTRSHIARALGNTRSRLAVPVLIGMFRDDPARDDVCDALITLTHRTWCDGGDDDVALRTAWRRWWTQMKSRVEIYESDSCREPVGIVGELRAGRIIPMTLDLKAAIVQVRRWVDESSRTVVLTGAGISTESGIPDFRGPQGLWTKDPKAEKLSNIHSYMSDPEVRKLAWQGRLRHPAWTATPNAGHRALVNLETRGKLHALVTQNIDGLHQRAGNSPDRVIEVHGTVHEVVCMGCDWRGPMPQVLERVKGGEDDPPCLECGGILKSATISFGQALVPDVIDRAMRAAAEADLFMAVGTTLRVYPIAGLVPLAGKAGARVIIVNAESTPFDHLADAVFSMPIGEVLPAICSEAGPVSFSA